MFVRLVFLVLLPHGPGPARPGEAALLRRTRPGPARPSSGRWRPAAPPGALEVPRRRNGGRVSGGLAGQRLERGLRSRGCDPRAAIPELRSAPRSPSCDPPRDPRAGSRPAPLRGELWAFPPVSSPLRSPGTAPLQNRHGFLQNHRMFKAGRDL